MKTIVLKQRVEKIDTKGNTKVIANGPTEVSTKKTTTARVVVYNHYYY